MGIVSSRKGKEPELVEAAMKEARSEEDEVDSTTKKQEEEESGTDESGSDDDDDLDEEEDEEEQSEEEDPEDEKRASESNRLASGMKGDGDEPCSFDLRNLLAINSHTIDTATLYKTSEKKDAPNASSRVTIPSNLQINEDYILQKAQQGCHQLLKSLWKLPQEHSDVGAVVTLPTFEDSRLPRALPLPPPRAETKWEKFAKAKGIGINQSKRSRKVWDEATGEWMYRTGYQKAGAKPTSWPIREANPDDPYADPWQADRQAQAERVTKNTKQRLHNVERAGGVEKGTTNRLLAGVPVDLPAAGRKGNADVGGPKQPQQRGQASTLAALRATQRSTASLGNFDRLREGEPERKQPKGAKRKAAAKKNTSNPTQTEQQRSLQMLQSMSRVDVKAKQQGRLATGETAYDYDYSDGLGPSTFRKRKGRAGAGKMKKMTKKRAK